MTRRLDAGPLLACLGALLLLVALFLAWYEPGLDAWTAFEVHDLLLAVVGVATLLAAAGLLVPDVAFVERRWLGPLAAVAVVVVVSQLVDPPPAAGEGVPEAGAWLALAAALVIAAGTAMTFARISLSVEVQERDARRHIAAVDARGGGHTQPFRPVGGEEAPPPRTYRAGEGARARPIRRSSEPGREEAGASPPPAEGPGPQPGAPTSQARAERA